LKKIRDRLLLLLLILGTIGLFIINLSYGEANISFSEVVHILLGGSSEYSSWSYIIESRFNRSAVAIFGGGALAVSGLILQVFFRNPLAGPGVLGVTSGASLGVAVVVLGGMTLNSSLNGVGVLLAGTTGAFLVLVLLLFISRFVKNQITLLVIGLMLGYFTSAFVNMLFLWADQSETREFVIWGLGSFEGLLTEHLYFFVGIIGAFLALSIFMIKGLNAMVLGEDYASSLGIDIKKQKILMIVITSVLAAIVTVYCGPISFIGIAVPQLIRVLGKSKNHAFLIPLCFLGGGFLGLGADLIVRISNNSLPLNTVTALIGAPIIIWTIIKMNKRFASL
jgi:cobalamin transport system permease protein